MPYAYCSKCDNTLSPPTPREILEGYITCSCGADHNLDECDKIDFILDLLDRIEKLEKLLQ